MISDLDHYGLSNKQTNTTLSSVKHQNRPFDLKLLKRTEDLNLQAFINATPKHSLKQNQTIFAEDDDENQKYSKL